MTKSNVSQPEVIFFGNGPLSDYARAILEQHTKIIFHARNRDDLSEVVALKKSHPHAFGVLASFGVLIKNDVLELFEPEGILNIHPSLLPQYRGASPIESAILAGDQDFSYSVMKLVKAMDAGPIYHQETYHNLPLDKPAIYRALAEGGAAWIAEQLPSIREITPVPQDDTKATFTSKLDKSMSMLDPTNHSAEEILRQIVAYQGFPKPKLNLYGKTCIILKAHLGGEKNGDLAIVCQDGNQLIIDEVQPEGKRPMDAKSFRNGYIK